MRHVALIAINFVREQRWPILVLMSWVGLLAIMGLFINLRTERDDVLFIFKQLGVYGIAFAVFFGASAIHNDRKTRRILAVLSKSVGRGQYISGLLAGIAIATGMYSFAMGLTGTWVLQASHFSARHIWLLMACLVLACLLAATVSVLFSTFMNPLFATLGTAVLLGVPSLAGRQLGSWWAHAIPAYSLLELLLQTSIGETLRFPWGLAALGAAETLLFWLFASWIFERRDIAVAVD
jgi:ABC-type transport system involved in multi-copper enzyme maturation permease subunit